jgi:hypothetical protein
LPQTGGQVIRSLWLSRRAVHGQKDSDPLTQVVLREELPDVAEHRTQFTKMWDIDFLFPTPIQAESRDLVISQGIHQNRVLGL